MKLLVEMYADGYDSEEERLEACKVILEDCDSCAITVRVLWDERQSKEELLEKI